VAALQSHTIFSLGTAIPIDPLPEYEKRQAFHADSSRLLEGRERLSGWTRIAAFLCVVAVCLVFSTSDPLFALFITVAAVGFFLALIWHRRVVRILERSRRASKYYSRGLDRLRNQWVGRGPTGDDYRDPSHPYSGDLDVFGRGSLFQYLCEAHTPVGQDTLAGWLKAPADPATIRARQTAIAELRTNLEIREALGVLSDPDRPELKSRALLSWPAAPPVLTGWRGPTIALVLGVLGLGGGIAWAFFSTGPSPLLLVGMIEVIFVASQWAAIREVTRDSRTMLAELTALLPILRLLESQKFSSPFLSDIQRDLTPEGELPSRRIARLARLLDSWDSATRNQFVLPFAIILMAPMHLVYAIERWRLREGRHVRGWLDAVGRFEAISSLSAFAFDHPDYPFPEILETGPRFEALELAHPLMTASKRIANDLALGQEPALLLVSGSNMSGKSTLMRTVGLNAVLALAGTPVSGRELRISPLRVATAMRQEDSLHEGVSAFYAEIRRLQAIRDLSREGLPVLFLLDEILRGTNSHDRRVGAEAVIAVLLRQGGIGMVSTHDLTLTEIVDRLGSQAANVHFEDQMTDGQVSFDYRLRPGVVPRGNGLVLLRLLGFEV
jgi:MutS domain V